MPMDKSIFTSPLQSASSLLLIYISERIYLFQLITIYTGQDPQCLAMVFLIPFVLTAFVIILYSFTASRHGLLSLVVPVVMWPLVSSAYLRLLMVFTRSWSHLQILGALFFSLCITCSAGRLNRHGDKLHPCRTPLLIWNHSDCSSLLSVKTML